eukprot:scaffold1593_cov193-Alexandrium_tamarense.AAC.100
MPAITDHSQAPGVGVVCGTKYFSERMKELARSNDIPHRSRFPSFPMHSNTGRCHSFLLFEPRVSKRSKISSDASADDGRTITPQHKPSPHPHSNTVHRGDISAKAPAGSHRGGRSGLESFIDWRCRSGVEYILGVGYRQQGVARRQGSLSPAE